MKPCDSFLWELGAIFMKAVYGMKKLAAKLAQVKGKALEIIHVQTK
jgi:hypothetical protein